MLLWRRPFSNPLDKQALRQYPAIKYQHLDAEAAIGSLNKDTTVYHVTKEFGPASMGGMGMVVTALAAAQQRSGQMQAAVVMPFYSFLKSKYSTEKVIDLVIDVRDKTGRQIPTEFRVWRMFHVFDPAPGDNITTYDIMNNGTPPATEKIPVYLIGPGNRKPFNQAFRARNVLHIYSSPQGLPQEWKDQYFNKAAAEFLAHQAAAADEISLFAPLRSKPSRVDVIHLHGATNAYVAKYMRDHEKRNQLGPRPPSILYTMHDYLDELQYTNAVKNVYKFLDADDDGQSLEPYRRSHRVFMSSLGIDYANVVTFVSRTMAADIIEGRMNFYLKELVMESLLRKAERYRFFGITNGIDFGKLNPFTHQRMVSRKLAYPEYAREQLGMQGPNNTTIWHLSSDNKEYVSYMKTKAKKYLIRRGLLNEKDLERPLVLFIGRFQYNKGLEMFDEAAKHFKENDMKFVVIGQPNNYPLSWVEALQTRYPEHVIVMSTARQQRDWAVFCRAAADFMFVPSLTESFGLVAAEGLLFGSPVISTGAGGLKEFLVDRSTSNGGVHVSGDKRTVRSTVTYNAYLFQPETMSDAIRDASMDYQRLSRSKARREEFVLRMIKSAFALGWDREHHQGPVYEYMRAYDLALNDRPHPGLRQHELDEEELIDSV